MTVPSPVPSDVLVLSRSKTRRDFRLSLALLLAGGTMFVASFLYTSWPHQTGHSPPDTAAGAFVSLLIAVLSGVGGLLILVGTIFTGVNGFFFSEGTGSRPERRPEGLPIAPVLRAACPRAREPSVGLSE